jgi:hypothetical protein
MLDWTGQLYFMHRDVALKWVIELSSCGTTCFQVGMLLRHWSVLAKKDVITALSKKFSDFGISKDQKRSALFKLEKRGLIRVTRLKGTNPTVVVVDGSISSSRNFGTQQKSQLTNLSEGLYFLHRDISLEWVKELSSCGSTCFQVGMLLRYWSVLEKADIIAATSKKFSVFNISKDQKRSALFELEKRGLIQVMRNKGANPRVVVVEKSGLSTHACRI